MTDNNVKPKHIFWGLLFVTFGVLILVNNFKPISLEWSLIWKFWPLVFVLWGLAIIIKHRFFKTLLTGIAAIILALAIFASFKTATHFFDHNFVMDWDEGNVQFDDSEIDTTIFSQPFDPAVSKASFHFDAGAGSFTLSDTTDSLFYAITRGYNNNYSLKTSTEDDEYKIQMEMRNTKIRFGQNNIKNNVNIRLNKNILWDIFFDVGAASMDLDLSPYRIEKIDINMGAAALDIKLGDINDETKFYIDAGASSIDISIPEEAGCEINADVSLSSKDFQGFIKLNSELYRTDNFESASKKIYIYIDSGVSSIDVRRYSGEW